MNDSNDRPPHRPTEEGEPSFHAERPATASSPAPRSEPPAAPPRSRTSWKPLLLVFLVSGFFFIAFVVGSFVFFSKGLDGKSRTAAKSLFKRQGVGVLEINGVIMDSKKALKTLEKFEENPEVKALVVRVNSPGGAVAPSQEIHDAVKRFPKPKVVSMSSIAASGGYYIAVAGDKVYANPGTITGSIGVIMEFANLEKLYEWAKIRRFSIKTGKFKDSGAEYREMQAEERALLQGMVDDVLLQFKTAVATGRKMPLEEVTPLADGRIFSGTQAKAAKLVDELGGIEDAVLEAGRLAGISGRPKVITDEKKKNPFEFLEDLADLDGDDEESSGSRSSGSRIVGALQKAVGVDRVKAVLEPGVYWIWKGAL
jgi:protease-4